jgi:antitoxin ParD1/3/4
MSNVEKISVSLPREMIDYMRESVDRGYYASTSEVLREAVRDWQRKEIDRRYENLRPKSHADLKRMIQEGIDSLDRGEGIPAEEVFAELTARYKKMAAERTPKRKGRG